MFSGSQRRNDGQQWTVAALRRAASGMRSYANALARLRLDFAGITRPLRTGKIQNVGHVQSVMARVRAVDRVLAQEYEVLERTKVDVGIAEMKRQMSKKPWMVMIEEQVEEEDAAVAAQMAEDDNGVKEDQGKYSFADVQDDSPNVSLWRV